MCGRPSLTSCARSLRATRTASFICHARRYCSSPIRRNGVRALSASGAQRACRGNRWKRPHGPETTLPAVRPAFLPDGLPALPRVREPIAAVSGHGGGEFSAVSIDGREFRPRYRRACAHGSGSEAGEAENRPVTAATAHGGRLHEIGARVAAECGNQLPTETERCRHFHRKIARRSASRFAARAASGFSTGNPRKPACGANPPADPASGRAGPDNRSPFPGAVRGPPPKLTSVPAAARRDGSLERAARKAGVSGIHVIGQGCDEASAQSGSLLTQPKKRGHDGAGAVLRRVAKVLSGLARATLLDGGELTNNRDD